MSMSNFIVHEGRYTPVMATKNPPAKPATDAPESGTGMAHPTVVPVNFDPDAPGNRRDRD